MKNTELYNRLLKIADEKELRHGQEVADCWYEKTYKLYIKKYGSDNVKKIADLEIALNEGMICI